MTIFKHTTALGKKGKAFLAVLTMTLPAVAQTLPVAELSSDSLHLPEQELKSVEVFGYRKGILFSRSNLLKTETTTQTGLVKMACCNLSESFENSASVSVGYTDAVSGAKQIQLLGLSGIYSQMLSENVPTLRGLAATYGWNYTPASWLESIQISKGAASVVNGYESITGQMNLEFKKPNFTTPLFVNLYTDENQHYEANVTSAIPVSEHLWTGLLLSGTLGTKAHDRNDDTFLDMPNIKYVNAYNRWFYLNAEKGVQSRTGIKFLYEERVAGQDTIIHKGHNLIPPGEPLFQTFINNKNFTVYNKTGITVGDKEGQSIGVINSFTVHDQGSKFGKKNFNGQQISYYANLLFTSFINNTDHRYTAGASFAYDNYETAYIDECVSGYPLYIQTPLTAIKRTEAVPGIFGEYTYSGINKLTLVAGLRTDYNSRFGWLVTPRAAAKYDIHSHITLRASAGRGFRSPNVIAENIGLMASSRRFDLSGINDLDMERAWNYGGNIAFSIPVWNGERAALSIDYFRTEFQNQAVVDYERNRYEVCFYNLKGVSYANAWQADLSLSPFRGFDVFAAFRYNTNEITYNENENQYTMEKPLVSNYRGLVNLSYATALRRWVFDATAQFNGRSRLPALNGYQSEKRYSPAYPLYFAQITKNSKRFDVYLGVENLLNYKQKEPVADWRFPFSPEFDASRIWGPIDGRRMYGGIRLRIGELL
ncbi:MAG: TonB-dependent receptor [Dysgonamonadaceae bacterium]|jgi:outer membrane receptor for ferrienterochelin and colicin|nr:TonB-dependent receptor [Dysgonamonadaceae bacterium]